MVVDYLKIGKATELVGRDRKIYRLLEIFPGFLSWGTLLALLILSFFKPVWVAYFIIAFDVYWLLLVLYLGLHLLAAYRKLQANLKIDWLSRLKGLESKSGLLNLPEKCLARQGLKWTEVIHIMIFPTSYEGLDIIRPSLKAIADDAYPADNIILVLATEERAGEAAQDRAKIVEKEFAHKFRNFLVTIHPDGIAGELKGKGANQAWAAKEVKEKIIDAQKIAYDKIVVSVFDMDTIIQPGYFARLTYVFLTVEEPYRASYQPVPVYHNNVWQASFFSRVAASSNTFWQMMQQIRSEKLATYSSHSMTWRALVDIGFWSTSMVSEDSRIYWHCFMYYNGDYRVEPMHFSVSMDTTQDESIIKTAKSLYKQQKRWGWGVENIPYLMFNTIRRWRTVKKRKALNRILVQIYGFHSWATNALIIGVVGWMPMLLGGDKFNSLVLSGNLPAITRTLMTIAMVGLVFSAIISTLLLPPRPKKYGISKNIIILFEWLLLPLSIVIFGAIPGLEAQTRLMLGGKFRLGFQVTPKGKADKDANWDQN